MIFLKRDEFKKMLESNPGHRFAFYEYTPDVFQSELHITDGDKTMPTFGAWAPLPVNPEYSSPLHDDDFKTLYDWNLMEDRSDQMYAILEEDEIRFFIEQLKGALIH